jgi:hypothetical protein
MDNILSTETVINESQLEWLLKNEKFGFYVGGRGGGKMASMIGGYHRLEEDNDIHFLYKTSWDGRKVSDLTSSHIINILLLLEREASRNKTSFEMYLLDFKEDELIKTKHNLIDIAKLSITEWLESLPIYKALITELEARNLKEYFEIVKTRKESENETR